MICKVSRLLLFVILFLINYNPDYRSLDYFSSKHGSDALVISKVVVEAAKGKKKADKMPSTAANIETTDLRRRILLPSRDFITNTAVASPVYPCDEKNSPNYMIYCQGELLHAVSLSNIFKDPKTFVDKPMKKEPEEIISAFNQKFPSQISTDDREALISFVDEHFDTEGSDIQEFAFYIHSLFISTKFKFSWEIIFNNDEQRCTPSFFKF